MVEKSSDDILSEISEHITTTHGIKINNANSINLGYANLKWKMNTDRGEMFVKQYNTVRYPEELLKPVETALTLQDILHTEGIPCPKLLSNNGSYIQRTSFGERYIATEFCEGSLVNPGEVNTSQMYHLGQITGRMHNILYAKAPQSLPLHWKPESKERMMQTWSKNWQEAREMKSNKYIAALETQRQIMNQIDLDLFHSCEKGWVHWDLFVDNILFHDSEVSSILDFDRMHYIYPEFDISRAILSGSIRNGILNIESANSFIKGYNESIPLTLDKLVRSIQLTWWKEVSWVNLKSENYRTLKRFVDELIWVGENWSTLKEIFGEMNVVQ